MFYIYQTFKKFCSWWHFLLAANFNTSEKHPNVLTHPWWKMLRHTCNKDISRTDCLQNLHMMQFLPSLLAFSFKWHRSKWSKSGYVQCLIRDWKISFIAPLGLSFILFEKKNFPFFSCQVRLSHFYKNMQCFIMFLTFEVCIWKINQKKNFLLLLCLFAQVYTVI